VKNLLSRGIKIRLFGLKGEKELKIPWGWRNPLGPLKGRIKGRQGKKRTHSGGGGNQATTKVVTFSGGRGRPLNNGEKARKEVQGRKEKKELDLSQL